MYVFKFKCTDATFFGKNGDANKNNVCGLEIEQLPCSPNLQLGLVVWKKERKERCPIDWEFVHTIFFINK